MKLFVHQHCNYLSKSLKMSLTDAVLFIWVILVYDTVTNVQLWKALFCQYLSVSHQSKAILCQHFKWKNLRLCSTKTIHQYTSTRHFLIELAYQQGVVLELKSIVSTWLASPAWIYVVKQKAGTIMLGAHLFEVTFRAN